VVLGIYSPDEAAEFDRPAAGPVYATPVESRAHEDAGGIIDVEAVELQADPRADLATAIRNSGLTGQQVSDYLEAHGRGRLADIPEAQAPAALAWFKGPGKAQVAAWLSKRHAERSAPPPARLPNAAKLVDALAEATGEHVDTVRLDVWLASNGVTAGLAGLGDHAAGQVFEYIVNGVRPHWVHEPWAADEADGDKGVAR
jgi:hypothetical protein